MKRFHQLFDLSDRVIIVAGGAGQIGFAFCEILADAGAKVVIADIDTEMAEQKRENLEPDLQEQIKVHALDVSQKTQVTELFDTIRQDVGSIYGLINSFHFKGNTRKLDTSSNFFADFEHYPEEARDLVHDVNLKGA
ncbi:MAG: SDR family oxidoreductase, partial [Chitinophagales bacterium]|nr:SDR family oxidoreductase [Chitinophagales bacterium]